MDDTALRPKHFHLKKSYATSMNTIGYVNNWVDFGQFEYNIKNWLALRFITIEMYRSYAFLAAKAYFSGNWPHNPL